MTAPTKNRNLDKLAAKAADWALEQEDRRQLFHQYRAQTKSCIREGFPARDYTEANLWIVKLWAARTGTTVEL